MAKKNQNNETVLGVCHVTRTKEELRALMDQQVVKGKDIYNKYPNDITIHDAFGRIAYDENTSNNFFREYRAWCAYCEEIYTSSFDNPNTKYLKEFKDAGQFVGIIIDSNQVYKDSKKLLLSQIDELVSFIDRLDLIVYP